MNAAANSYKLIEPVKKSS